MNKLFLILILGIIMTGFVSGTIVNNEVLKEFEKGNEKIRVIVEKNNMQNRAKTFKNMNVNADIQKITEDKNKFTAYVTQKEFENLQRNPEYKKIRRDIPLKIFMQDTVGITKANKTWNLINAGINLTGVGQSVCILDTGINRTHPDFAGKIIAEKCFCSVSDLGLGGCCPDNTTVDDFADDGNGHGTHVAGIVGANGGLNGIATKVGLVIVKIMDNNGDGTSSDMENAIQWCIDNKDTYNISVITASLGDETTKYTSGEQAACNTRSAILTSKFDNAVANNISITIASGNNGWNDGITWPSCIISATPISAINKINSLFYNRNSLVKLLGIGVNINSTSYTGGYTIKSGTSMATPVVAGAISIINQYLKLTSRTMTPTEIENTLYQTGLTISELGNNYSRINIYDALLSLDKESPNVTLISPQNNYISAITNETFICYAEDWQLSNATLKIWNSSGLYFNQTKNLTGEKNQTTFNITNMLLGNYNWNCEVIDAKNNIKISNSNNTLTIGAVEVTLNLPKNNSYTNTNYTEFNCTSITDSNFELKNISFYLWNETNYLLKNETKNISGIENITIFNYTFNNNSKYIWECVATNNESLKGDGINFTINYDSIIPIISNLRAEEITSSSVVINWNTDEETNSSISGGIAGNDNTYMTTHAISFSGLSSSTTYNYNIKSCDKANNCANQSENFTTTSVPTSSPSGSRSSTKTYKIKDQELEIGNSEKLREKDKMIFSLESKSHELKVLKIKDNSVDITIQSDPLYLTLLIGEEQKLNMSSPKYYDLLIKLNSINYKKANITIQRIFENIVVEKNKTGGNKTNDNEEIALRIFKDDKPKPSLLDRIITEFSSNKQFSFIFVGIAIMISVFFILEGIKSKKLTKKEKHHNIGKHKVQRHVFTSIQRVPIKNIKYNKSKKIKTTKTYKKKSKNNKKEKYSINKNKYIK